MRRSVLIALPLVPWPPRAHGISVRFYPLLSALADASDVHLLVVGETRDHVPDDPLIERLASFAYQPFHARQASLVRRAATLLKSTFPYATPYGLASHWVEEIALVVAQIARERSPDTILWATSRHADCLTLLNDRLPNTRVVLDFVDSPYLHATRAAGHVDGRRLLTRLALRRLSVWERRLAASVDHAVFITQADANAACNGLTRPPVVIPNGVLPPRSELPSRTAREGKVIGFLGNMGYAPNVRAALILYKRIFEPLARLDERLQLKIIGREPVAEVLALAGNRVSVTGEVDDIWDAIADVDVFVFPMETGAGLQNKILEAMWASRPVVTTNICNDGLGAREGDELLCRDNVDDLRSVTAALLTDRQLADRIGMAGRRFVERNFSLARTLPDYLRLLLE